MVNIYICDDSVDFRQMLGQALKKQIPLIFPDTLKWKIEAEFDSGKELLKHVETNSVDVLFLDIDMPEMNGFELAKQIMIKNKEAVIIFVSGFDNYVYQVFEFFPFAYLRKSHLLEELPAVVKRVSDKYNADNKTISLLSVAGAVKLDVRDIVYIRSEGNYYIVQTKGGSCKCRGTLNEIEEQFSNFDFYRIHSAYIVNLNHIQQVCQNEVILSNENNPIPIAQRRLSGFRAAYSEFTIRSFNL